MSHQRRRVFALSLLAWAPLLLAGCADKGASPIPPSSEGQGTASPTTEQTKSPDGNFGGEARPSQPEGDDTDASPSASQPEERDSELIRLEVGKRSYEDLDWNVSCSGLDGSPTVIASAKDGDRHLVVMLLGGSDDQVGTFTFNSSKKGEGLKGKSGLNVNPGIGQGNGSFELTGSTIRSSGRGVSYGPNFASEESSTVYSFEVFCGK